ncbi:MAG TPA: Os1348 family NHLP clan protein [Anaerolineae bacterium]|nr:Os1348 family NHLP clan protein [Anaerolineae bacterium]
MGYPALEEVVGHAIIDREFRAGLLNGTRARLLSQFNLTPDETQVLMSIRADSLEAFAGQLYRWIEAQQPRRRQLRPA